jgi:iron complex transport system ATP-binding protein
MGLTAESLTLTLGHRRVVDGVDLTLASGKITVLLGPNGAGKTSLLRALAGLIVPHGGSACLDSADIAHISPRDRARRIGYLPQSAELAWSLPVREVVALGRHPWRSPFAALGPADVRLIDEALTATDTIHLADRLTGELSGGERARVLLARVICGTPEWLLADEPLASLDPAHQLDILDRFRAIADTGCGVVLVLHDLNHAVRIADEVILLRDGRLVTHGSATAVLDAANIGRVFDLTVDIVPATGDRPPQIIPRGRLPLNE